MKQLPVIRAILAQLISSGAVAAIYQVTGRLQITVSPLMLLALHSVLAAGIGYGLSLRRWWIIFNFCFVPLLLLLISASLPAWLYLVTFTVLLLAFSNSITRGVPLYLSGRPSLVRIRTRLENYGHAIRFLDLGCGLGSAICFLSRSLKGSTFVGVENAPLVYLFAKLRSLTQPNLTIRFGSIWDVPWGSYDVVYCFLSPVPMPDVWKKARAEMKPGSLLISNTFEIPGVSPHEVIDMKDWRGSKIFIWRM